jgi:hypothetical protein
MKRKPIRQSLRDQMLGHQRSMDMYAQLAGKPAVEIRDVHPEPKTRALRDPTAERAPLESEIQDDIIARLRAHPMVGLVTRVNSGSAVETNSDGSHRHIAYHHIFSVRGMRFRMVDIDVTLGGPGPWAGKRLVIEVKRPPWTKPTDERERGQEALIAFVQRCGGYGTFATSWEDVDKLLERIRGA